MESRLPDFSYNHLCFRLLSWLLELFFADFRRSELETILIFGVIVFVVEVDDRSEEGDGLDFADDLASLDLHIVQIHSES
jgi:hypothetical protein